MPAQVDTCRAAAIIPIRGIGAGNVEAVSGTTTSAPLAAEVFSAVVANAPLIAIDLIVENAHGAVLLGMRTNPPARDCWFVPGGRIRKNETLDHAFARITHDELGQSMPISSARFVGVFEHFYDTDFNDTAGATTHYVVLAYRLQSMQSPLPHNQHSQYIWLPPQQVPQHPHVHFHTQAYFLN
jgi:colanic acid biosynthesis protein WcaH